MVEVLDTLRLERYAEWCGWALARAHAKSGDAAMISGYLGARGRFDDAVAKLHMPRLTRKLPIGGMTMHFQATMQHAEVTCKSIGRTHRYLHCC